MPDWILVLLVAALLVREFMPRDRKRNPIERLIELDEEIRDILRRILRRLTPLPTGGLITQIGDNNVPTNNSIVAGQSGVFQVTPTPAGSSVPAADSIVFAASDPSISIAASPDGDRTKAVVGVPAGSTLTSFQLACQFSGPDFPAPVNATPITVSVVPAVVLPTGGTIAQLS